MAKRDIGSTLRVREKLACNADTTIGFALWVFAVRIEMPDRLDDWQAISMGGIVNDYR